jgi:hypothetical protein
MSNLEYSRGRLLWLRYRWVLRWVVALPGFGAVVAGANAAYWPTWVGDLFSGDVGSRVHDIAQPAAAAVKTSPLTGVSLIIIGILAVALAARL